MSPGRAMLGRMAIAPQDDTGIDVVNAPQDLWIDLYHELLGAPWPLTLLAIVGLWLSINVAFAVLFMITGGVANARPGSFADAFFFSVQTLGTIGYGTMYPQSTAAQLGMTVETIVALVAISLATGVVFTKFSMPVARLEFARSAVVSVRDGERTLAIRIANRRGNFIVEAQVRVTLVQAETTKEGVFTYRMHELQLVRDHSAFIRRSWTILHRLDGESPLRDETEESVRAADLELQVSVYGLDGTTFQTLHSRHRYLPEDIRFGMRFADMLAPKPDGRLQLDYAKLHETEPA